MGNTWPVHEAKARFSAFLAASAGDGPQIATKRGVDAAKEEELASWLRRVVVACGILPMDAAAFREWARLKHRKSDSLIEDAMIAATAKVHGLTVATTNVRDFRAFGVDTLNPFDSRCDSAGRESA